MIISLILFSLYTFILKKVILNFKKVILNFKKVILNLKNIFRIIFNKINIIIFFNCVIYC